MDDKAFSNLWKYAQEVSDKESYVADFADSIRPYIRTEEKRKEYLGKVWDVAHTPIRDLITQAGYNQSTFARRFCVPLRTVQGWCSDSCSASRGCPPYVKLGFARQLGML